MIDFYKSKYYIAWRPTLGWAIVVSVIVAFIFIPIVRLLCFIFYPEITIANLTSEQLLPLITVALGSTALRTYEKGKKDEI